MAVYRFYDPGMKDSMDAVARVMQTVGQFERQRQDAQLSSNLMRIASEPAGSPEERMQKVYSEVANFKPSYGGGLAGVMQKTGNFFAPQSQMPQRMGGMAVDDLLQQINRQRDTEDYGTRLKQQGDQTVATAKDMAPVRKETLTDELGVRNDATVALRKITDPMDTEQYREQTDIAGERRVQDSKTMGQDRNQLELEHDKKRQEQDLEIRKGQRDTERLWSNQDMADQNAAKYALAKKLSTIGSAEKKAGMLLDFFAWNDPTLHPDMFSVLVDQLGGDGEKAVDAINEYRADSQEQAKTKPMAKPGVAPGRFALDITKLVGSAMRAKKKKQQGVPVRDYFSAVGSPKGTVTMISPEGVKHDGVDVAEAQTAPDNWRVLQ